MSDGREFRHRLDRIESLVRDLEECPDSVARENSRELVRTLLDLHATGIARMLELAPASKEDWARDHLVSSLLLLHGLHPIPPEERVRTAIANVRSKLRAVGADIEIAEVSDTHVCIRLFGDSTQASHARALLEAALMEAAPDIEAVTFEEHWNTTGMRIPLLVAGARG